MSQIDDGQAASVIGGKADAAALGAGGTNTVGGARDATAQTFVSATAKQVLPNADAYLYINITTAAALAIAMGPTSGVANVISISQSSAIGVVTLFVPAGWYVKLTGTMADLSALAIEA